MRPFVSPMLLGKSDARLIASGVAGNGVSIPVSTSGAAVDDILIVFSPFNGLPTLGGSGWTSWTDSFNGGGSYVSAVAWKRLTATTDVTISGDTYGHAYMIWRGAKTVARNAFNDGTAAVTFGTLGGASSAIAILAGNQTTDQPAATCTGFTNGGSGYPNSVFNIDILTAQPGSAGAKTMGGWTVTSGTPICVQALEIRV